jgi:hypothetical protein
VKIEILCRYFQNPLSSILLQGLGHFRRSQEKARRDTLFELPPPFSMSALGAYAGMHSNRFINYDPQQPTQPQTQIRLQHQHQLQHQSTSTAAGNALDEEMREDSSPPEAPSTAPIDPTQMTPPAGLAAAT